MSREILAMTLEETKVLGVGEWLPEAGAGEEGGPAEAM